MRCGLGPQSKNAERRVFCLCTFAQSAGAFRSVKSGKSVCACNLPIKAAAVFLYTLYMVRKIFQDKFLLYLTLAVLLLRVGLFFYVMAFNPLGSDFLHFPDSLYYTAPAQTLLTSGQLTDPYSLAPLTFRTPGYPVFLALIYAVSGQSAWAVVFVQILLITALVPLVYHSAAVFLSKTAARAAGVLCAFSTVLAAYAFALLSDVLFAFLLTVFLFFALCYIKSGKWPRLLAASLFLTAAIFVRPVAYNWLYLGAVLVGLKTYRQGCRKCVCALLVFCLPILACTGAWQWRNYRQAGYAGFHSSAAYNLYFWNLDAVGHARGLNAQGGDQLLHQALPAGFWQFSPTQKDEWLLAHAKPMLRKFWPYKLAHAPYWLAKTLLGGSYTQISRIIRGTPPLSQAEFDYQLNKTTALPTQHLRTWQDYILLGLCGAQTLLTALLAGLGAVILWINKRRAETVFLGLFAGYFWAISSVFFGAGGRYRLPFETALCLLGGAGLAWLCSKLCPRLNR